MSGKICSRTSPRAGDDAEALGALAEGKVSVRTEAGVGAATGELCGCAAGFFSAAACRVLSVAAGEDGLGADAACRCAGCSTRFGCAAGGGEGGGGGDGRAGRRARDFWGGVNGRIIRRKGGGRTR